MDLKAWLLTGGAILAFGATMFLLGTALAAKRGSEQLREYIKRYRDNPPLE